jgi:hypothetical protein
MAWLKAVIYYFVTVFAVGVVLGPLSDLVVRPRVGGLAAVLVEVPVMVAAMVFFAPRAARWAGLRGGSGVDVAMGVSALGLVLAAEALAGQTLRGWSRRPKTSSASPSMSFSLSCRYSRA